jgi:hypothetical protein
MPEASLGVDDPGRRDGDGLAVAADAYSPWEAFDAFGVNGGFTFPVTLTHRDTSTCGGLGTRALGPVELIARLPWRM